MISITNYIKLTQLLLFSLLPLSSKLYPALRFIYGQTFSETSLMASLAFCLEEMGRYWKEYNWGMFGFIKSLFFDNLTPNQEFALTQLSSQFSQQKAGMEAELYKAMQKGYRPGYEVDFACRNLRESFQHKEWFIRNHPHLIDDLGRILPQINKGNGLQYVSWDEFNKFTSL